MRIVVGGDVSVRSNVRRISFTCTSISWVIAGPTRKAFYSGDTGYFDGFKEIGKRFGPFDLTLIETGAYNELWPDVHMQPEQTLQAHRDLGGKWLMPVHNGTFNLSLHVWAEPFERITALAAAAGLPMATPEMGEALSLVHPHTGGAWWRNVDEAGAVQAMLDAKLV